MKNKYKIILLITLICCLFISTGFFISRIGPWWGMKNQASNPSATTNGIKLFSSSTNKLTSIDANSVVSTLSGVLDPNGRYHDITFDGAGTIATTSNGDINLTPNGSGTTIVTGTLTADTINTNLFTTQTATTDTRQQISTTSAFLIGNSTAVGSFVDANSAGTTTITKTAHGLSVAAGNLIHITDCTTSGDKGFYRLVSTTADTFVVDRALSGSDTDVDGIVYKDVIGFYATDGTNGTRIAGSSHQDKPLQLGGDTLAASNHSLGSEDIIVANFLEINGILYCDDTITIAAGKAIRFQDAYFNLAQKNDDGFVFAVGNTDNYTNRNLIISDFDNRNKDHDHDTLSSNTTVFIHDVTDPDTTNNKWGSFNHDGNGFVINTGAATGAGDTPATIDNYIGFQTTSDGMIKQKFWNEALADDANYVLPSFTNCCWGKVIVGNAEEYAAFIVDNDGDVTLLTDASANVVANADTDAKFCIGTAATQEPLDIKNRLGGSKNVFMIIQYN